MGVECVVLTRAIQIARTRDLIGKNESISCDYIPVCDGTSCRKAEEPTYRTVFFHQGNDSPRPTQTEKLVSKLRRRQGTS